jgi:hypothetical protein
MKRRMLTYADVCGRMLRYADLEGEEEVILHEAEEFSFQMGQCHFRCESGMLAAAWKPSLTDVC